MRNVLASNNSLPSLLGSVTTAILLAGCGGGDSASAGAANAQSTLNMHATAAVAPNSPAMVVAMEEIAETRVSRSVFDYTFKITVQNGSVAQSGVTATLTKVGVGSTILDGTSVIGNLAANASVTPADTVTIRVDRSFTFGSSDVAWTVAGTPVQTVVFDPSRCTPQANAPYGQTVGITGTNMMVTSADIQASTAGCKVLASGGTAIDATIAVQAVLGVAEPFASGMGGGSVITYYDAAAKKVHTYDGLSSAPAMTGGMPDIYKAVAQDVSTTAPFNVCKSGLAAGASISAQQGNTNISARAFGVPGTLKVLDMVYRSYGKTPWNQLWGDAIELANHGFPMTPYMYTTLYAGADEYDDDGNLMTAGSGVAAWVNSAGTVKGASRCKYPDINARYCDATDAAKQKPLPVGTLIRNIALAETMERVRDGGAAAFYDPNGPIAQAVIAKVTSGQLPCKSILPSPGTAANPAVASTIASIPSLMTTADFASYRAVERQPLSGTRFGQTIYTQPAPSFGGVVQLYTLGLLERKNLQSAAPVFNGLPFVHLTTEASRLANADRRNVVGDPAYSNTRERIGALLSSPYLDARAGLITGTALGTVPTGGVADGVPPFVATDPAGFDPMVALASKPSLAKHANAVRLARSAASKHDEDWNTTSNVAVIDGYGNALSMTTTINTHWGAHIEAAGIMLNNALSNFSASTPGLDVNGYAPFKRPRSSISPSLAFDASGRLSMVWGSAGGGPIPDYIVKTFLGTKVYGMDVQAAINADNWTGQNGIAELEAGKPIADTVAAMKSAFGNTSSNVGPTGLTSGLSGIAIDYDANGLATFHGAADNRRNGSAVGY
jgi:gamma-glutamyltranspeptidase / glutathione hydrolase